MKTNKIVAFHIGRGGRFNNSGFLTFIGEKKIGEFTDGLHENHENLLSFKERFGYESTNESTQKCIIDLTTDEEYEELEEKFGITEEMLGEKMFYDGGGNCVGLTDTERESGIGRINIDNDYNTTYTRSLEDCNDAEIAAIRQSNDWNINEILSDLSLEEESEQLEGF